MSQLVAITQRVDQVPGLGERRDCLDQRWSAFLHACGLVPVVIPNDPAAALALVDAVRPAGLILTGGNDLAAYGGGAPERDATEQALVEWAADQGRGVIGVCRGFQMLAHLGGAELVRVDGHVAQEHPLTLIGGGMRTVNSYHSWATARLPDGWAATAVADDGVVEAARSMIGRQFGIMWHPEREAVFNSSDIALFAETFGETR